MSAPSPQLTCVSQGGSEWVGGGIYSALLYMGTLHSSHGNSYSQVMLVTCTQPAVCVWSAEVVQLIDVCLYLAPTPPMNLVTLEDSATPTSYVFSWSPPSNSRGELIQYKLTCLGHGGDTRTMTFEPSVTTGTITALMYTSYICYVQASNMDATSDPSNEVDIIINETGMYV